MTNIDVINDAIYIFFSPTDKRKKVRLSSEKVEISQKPLLALRDFHSFSEISE
jgi:hypothetical protein